MTTIQTVGVAGAGTMGAGIAIVAARAGFRTIVFDMRQEALDRARGQTEAFLTRSEQRGKLPAGAAAAAMQRWKGTTELSGLAECDLIIEAIFEDLSVKHQLFGKLNEVCQPSTIFASNTSTISITQIAGGSGRPDCFVGMHFCLPAQLMKLIEMSPGLATSDDTFQKAWAFAQAMGQKPVATQDTPGFILNYFLIPFNNDAIRLVEQGVAEPADIDVAIKTAMGYPMGPLELLDLVGMDTQKLLCEAMHGLTHEPRAACPPLVRRMIAANRLGKKTGQGFRTYDDTKMFGA
ncbi:MULTISPECIES: 3-hydroxyacyl-CoA dehydrogenase family protein [Cupriavidus]|uniref:3-hydroxyacyl-CoA dehydrogenase family protein n=1 Tax=Cupriavidus basilensis TaxID=68895 RepID=A0A643G212_9BURK|nr:MULTISPECIES: 3-hydroxyacyl-CoA dehydrogenase family protein [Cupriavidus]KUE88049.1 3-hydroxybutyryl-CoA dehydrogenase [Cupriavidus necator]NOV23826.1 3-hydroxyacyl-CoA dehydrogenase family protein [Cupriavidus necator]QOT81543.1 3-hydroxyacyl-CoA dehydrogenase family protein [Cupriavidus basilensis]